MHKSAHKLCSATGAPSSTGPCIFRVQLLLRVLAGACYALRSLQAAQEVVKNTAVYSGVRSPFVEPTMLEAREGLGTQVEEEANTGEKG